MKNPAVQQLMSSKYQLINIILYKKRKSIFRCLHTTSQLFNVFDIVFITNIWVDFKSKMNMRHDKIVCKRFKNKMTQK